MGEAQPRSLVKLGSETLEAGHALADGVAKAAPANLVAAFLPRAYRDGERRSQPAGDGAGRIVVVERHHRGARSYGLTPATSAPLRCTVTFVDAANEVWAALNE